MFSVGYDCHKVSLGCWSSQPAAIKATSPLSHEMTWQAAQRQHTTLNQWCSSSTPTKPQGKCWHNTNMCYSTEVHAKCTVFRKQIKQQKQQKKRKWNYAIQKWSGFPLLSFSSSSSFSLLSILMGTEGTDGESSSPYCPSSPPPPFPDVCILIILAPWLALPLCLLTAPFISI